MSGKSSVSTVPEEHVKPREGERASTDHDARRHGAPQNVRAGKFPNRQQAGHDRHENTQARRPES